MTVDTIHRPPGGRIMLTYEDYVCLPDDGKTYEILEGEIEVTPAPIPRHQDVSRNTERILDEYVRREGAGKVYDAPIDVVLDEHNIVQPDLLFISTPRLHIIGEKNIQGMPDLIAEILSPTTRRRDRVLKLQMYARHGLAHYWILDPEHQTLEAFELDGGTGGRGIVRAPVVPRSDDRPRGGMGVGGRRFGLVLSGSRPPAANTGRWAFPASFQFIHTRRALPASQGTKPPGLWSEGFALRPPGRGALPRRTQRDGRSGGGRAPIVAGARAEPSYQRKTRARAASCFP